MGIFNTPLLNKGMNLQLSTQWAVMRVFFALEI